MNDEAVYRTAPATPGLLNMLNVFNVTSDMNTIEREHQIKDIFHQNIFKSSFDTELHPAP